VQLPAESSCAVYIVEKLSNSEKCKMDFLLRYWSSLISFIEAWTKNNGLRLKAQIVLFTITFAFLFFTDPNGTML